MKDKYFGRYRLLYVFIVFYFLIKTPAFFLPLPIYQIRLLSTISDVYLVSFMVFVLINNYEKIKSHLQKNFIGKILDKDENIRSDLLRFIAMALLITFFIDIFLTTISGQSLVSIFMDFLPGFGFVKSPTASIDQQNAFKAGSLKMIVNYLPGPPIGALVLFSLRQIRYKSKFKDNKEEDYPGGNILLGFLVIV